MDKNIIILKGNYKFNTINLIFLKLIIIEK